MEAYTLIHEKLKSLYSPNEDIIGIEDSNITIRNVLFESEVDINFFSSVIDMDISENRKFSYPVFVPANRSSDEVILLFHGLNERTWDKYLAWAYYLAKESGSYVVLFPISFHINRSPSSWRDPRSAFQSYNNRKMELGSIEKSSLANVILSRRLSETPLRFFSSGYQTIDDVCRLVELINKGGHQIIPKTDKINIFAYSIGAFMAQILMIANPKRLFEKTRLFIFCGGSVFSYMKGTSKYIMDKLAYDRVFKFFVDDFENILERGYSLYDFFQGNRLGLAFRAMLSITRGKDFREREMSRLGNHVYSISLANDLVIPAKGVLDTLNDNKLARRRVEVMDFSYDYCHESPFPIYKDSLSEKVDESFIRIFSEAITFFSR